MSRLSDHANKAPQHWLDRLQGLSRTEARAVAFLAGALLSLGFAPLSLFPVIFLSLPLLVLLIDRSANAREAFGLGWWFGVGHFMTGLYWVGISFAARDDMPDWGGVVASLALAIALAWFIGIAMMAARLLWCDGWRRVLVFTLAFSGFEWLRGHLFTGFPWNLTANIWERLDGMVQAVSLLGSYGLGFFTILAAASLALLVSGRPFSRQQLMLPGLSVAMLVCLWGWGAYKLERAQTTYHSDVSLRIVQASIPQREKWRRDKLGDNYVRHMQMSVEDSANGEPSTATHVIWPETAFPYYLDTMPSKRFFIARDLGNQATLITGAVRRPIESGRAKAYNSVQAVGPDGSIVATYDKFHLVPFGEYLPFHWILGAIGLGNMVGEDSGFSRGPGPQTLTIPGLPPVGPLVCYEVIFPGAVVDPSDRPQWLLNLTNDGWYGDSSGPYQHLVMTRFRAAEEGLPIVRAAGTGISAVIDAYGRVLDSLPLNRAGVIDTRLPRARMAPTLYARFGDWIYFGLLLGTAVFAMAGRRRS